MQFSVSWQIYVRIRNQKRKTIDHLFYGNGKNTVAMTKVKNVYQWILKKKRQTMAIFYRVFFLVFFFKFESPPPVMMRTEFMCSIYISLNKSVFSWIDHCFKLWIRFTIFFVKSIISEANFHSMNCNVAQLMSRFNIEKKKFGIYWL